VGLFDRIILTLYTFSLILLSFVIVAVALGWLAPLEFVQSSLQVSGGRWIIGLIGLTLLVVSLRLLYFAFRRTRATQVLIRDTERGRVDVTLGAIENLVERVGYRLSGVREIRPGVSADDAGGVQVRLVVKVSPDVSVPQLAEELQNNIKRYVRNVVGLPVASIDVHVRDFTTEFKRHHD